MEAYIRIGNESVTAPDYVVNELILKGSHRSFDSVITDTPKTDYSFTLLEATYRERAGLRFEQSDYVSFGLANKDGLLTNAGKLLTDQHNVYNARLFCTRWNGFEKGSIFDDALDDKEFEGSLIHLLQSGMNFVKNNSKVRFEKKGQYRVDKPDYSERAITEALVNALIHRDYLIMGSEVHIDMFHDRLEITSPGGMYAGKTIQECNIDEIDSVRRNPIIADLFHRMKYMERRGSGLKKILSETMKMTGYTDELKPIFSSTVSSFTVVLKNMNGTTTHDKIHDTTHDEIQDEKIKLLLEFCSTPKARDEIQEHIGISNRSYFSKNYLKPLIEAKLLVMTIPDKPTSKNQKYVAMSEK